MKNIIVYYSNTRNNELLALHLQKKLSCDVLKIEEVNKRTGLTILLDLIFNRNPKLKEHAIPLEQYGHFIFVAPIWAGKIASPLRSFWRKEKRHIKSYSFITLCGGIQGQLEKIRKQASTIVGLEPTLVKELWTSKLPSAKNISNYHVTPDDLEYYKEEENEFLIAQIASSEVEHQKGY
jgi:flavodoxin